MQVMKEMYSYRKERNINNQSRKIKRVYIEGEPLIYIIVPMVLYKIRECANERNDE